MSEIGSRDWVASTRGTLTRGTLTRVQRGDSGCAAQSAGRAFRGRTGNDVRARVSTAVMGGLGSIFVLWGAWAAVDSGSFAQVLADFGPAKSHLVHDYGAGSPLALAVSEAALLVVVTVLLAVLAARTPHSTEGAG